MNESLSSNVSRSKTGNTLMFCKKHRSTPIKFAEITEGGKLARYVYFCDECAKEKKPNHKEQ